MEEEQVKEMTSMIEEDMEAEDEDMGETGPGTRRRELIDTVFSWSMKDVLNTNLYTNKVEQIPTTFLSTSSYMESFIFPLVEETHADLYASMLTISTALTCEILSVEVSKDYKPPKDLLYDIYIGKTKDTEIKEEKDEIKAGDLIAITDSRPQCTDDLNRPRNFYLVALVQRVSDETDFLKLRILASKPIVYDEKVQTLEKKQTLFAVFLMNMSTNNRIWEALNLEERSRNLNIISGVLQPDSRAWRDCDICSKTDECNLRPFGLNSSQEEAVLKLVATKGCYHKNTVKLIWGPPGTGKTKTISVMLFELLRMKCRTLVCAPTNLAVLEVTRRLLSLVGSVERDSYGLGNIVLFGNRKRMKIDDDNKDLSDIFLDDRAKILARCFAPHSGWRHCLRSMILLLKEPKTMYDLYLKEKEQEDGDDGDKEDDVEKETARNGILKRNGETKGFYAQSFIYGNNNRMFRKGIIQALKENSERKIGNCVPLQKKKHLDTYIGLGKKKKLEIGDFMKKKFKFLQKKLESFAMDLATHLPTSCISLEDVENMFRAVSCLQDLETLRCSTTQLKCIELLKSLPESFIEKDTYSEYSIKRLCLDNAVMLFCTASSSYRLLMQDMTPVELLVVDEAGQLKECESTIPLQVRGLRHTILIGDEQQLPALVKSKISEKAGFGRSLFERLVILGHKKFLLNFQYRMHPSISWFPNREFYDRKLLDAPNVKEKSYQKRFLEGALYGSYSFINICCGKEESDGHGFKNMVEVAAVANIVSRLYQHSIASKQKVGVGVISPYKAQVSEIRKKLGTTYSTDPKNDFFVRVRSVDGFQGGEEDIIIISTVRNNGNRKVGFLDNRRRVNVAITRARYCLWILGNEPTLKNSGTVWKKLISDAKARGCLHDASKDINLAREIVAVLVDIDQLDIKFNIDSLLFEGSLQKVYIDNGFWMSMEKIKDLEIRKEALLLLTKLSSGWRQPHKSKICYSVDGICSQLFECYEINEQFYLVWSVETRVEFEGPIEVVKVWDIVAYPNLPQQAMDLELIPKAYTENPCIDIRMEGDDTASIPSPENMDAHMSLLSSKFAKLNLNKLEYML